MKSYSAQKEHHTSTSIKNVQNQKLHLAKNYLEQELEVQGHRGHVTYDQTRKALVQFRIKEGTVAVLQDGKLSIFKMPVKKFRGAYPLEVQSVDMELIKTQKATCCKKCKEWKKSANITRCSCGGYLVSRKRFAVDAIPSWDAEFLEIEFARKDIALAKKTDRVLAHKTKAYIPTGIITHKLAGMSSISKDSMPKMIPRISEQGATWLEEFGTSPLGQNVIIRKINGFNIPSNDENIQASLRTRLRDSFSSEVNN